MSKKGWILLACLCLTAIGVVAAARGVVVVKDETGQSISLYGGSHALLIGVSDYTDWPKLENVPSELGTVKQLLTAQGFNVVEVSNPNAVQLRRAFQAFINDHGRSPDNRLLFFFSGHGHTLEKGYRREMGYIVAADAPLPYRDRNGFLSKAVSMNQVLTWAREIDAKHALFLFDSCFSGTVFKARNLPENPPHISRLTAEPVREFITAGSAGETVPAESVFTPAFVDALRYRLGDLDKDGFVTGMELGLHLQAKVPRHTGQTPQYGKIHDYPLSRGDFVFALQSAPPPPPVQFLGNVQVNVNLPARVYIGNEQVGQAAPGKPLNRTGVPAGSTQVRVEAEGHQPQARIAQVHRGKWAQLVFELVPEVPVGVSPPRPVSRDDPQAEEAALNLTQSQRRKVQQALNERGFAAGSADGVLGRRSREALAAYQRSEGQKPTGYLTAKQWTMLKFAVQKEKRTLSMPAPSIGGDSTSRIRVPEGSLVAQKVTEPVDLKRIAVVPFGWQGQGAGPKHGVAGVIRNDLQRSGRFDTMPAADMLAHPQSDSEVEFRDWRELGMENLVVGQLKPNGSGGYLVRFQLFDVFKGEQLNGYTLPTAERDLRATAHHIADIIYEKLTGQRGAFATRIAYVTSIQNAGESRIALKVADADGYDAQTIVTSKEPLMSPTWSPDGRKLAYVSFELGNTVVFVQEVYTGRREKLSATTGVLGGVAYSPDGRSLAFSLARDGQSDIYTLDIESKSLRRLTHDPAEDINPAWSVDGNEIVFSSKRNGSSKIYRVSLKDGDVEQLTSFDGHLTYPTYSPDGKSLLMVASKGKEKNVALMNLSTRIIRELAQVEPGTAPRFAQNGTMISYISKINDKRFLQLSSLSGVKRYIVKESEGEILGVAWSR